MTRIWLVRHAQTAWANQGTRHDSDPPLGPIGREGALRLAEVLCGIGFAAVYSSGLRRAVETAEILAHPLNLPVRIDPRLREASWSCSQEHADPIAGGECPLLGGVPVQRGVEIESLDEVAGRAGAAVTDMAREHPGASVIAVSHGLTIGVLLCLAKRVGLEQAYLKVPFFLKAQMIAWDADSPVSGVNEPGLHTMRAGP